MRSHEDVDSADSADGAVDPVAGGPTAATVTVLTRRFDQAVEYAVRMHAGQVRKGTSVPYVAHPLAVSSLVLDAGGTEDEAIAGLLHDVPEDCGGEPRLTEINDAFGPQVARIVRACSDSITDDPEHKAPWRQRKESHLAHLRGADGSIALVTAADKLHNARAILADVRRDGVGTLARFTAGASGVCWYYRSLVEVLTAGPAPRSLTVELSAVVADLVGLVEASGRTGAGTLPNQEGSR